RPGSAAARPGATGRAAAGRIRRRHAAGDVGSAGCVGGGNARDRTGRAGRAAPAQRRRADQEAAGRSVGVEIDHVLFAVDDLPAAVGQAALGPPLPFFIEWQAGTPLPGSARRADALGALAIASLRLTGDSDRLNEWLGRHSMPISVRRGGPAVTGITLAGPAGE